MGDPFCDGDAVSALGAWILLGVILLVETRRKIM